MKYSGWMSVWAICAVLLFTSEAAAANLQSYQESDEAAKVAGWLRDAVPSNNNEAYFGVIGLQNLAGFTPAASDLIKTQGPAAFYQNAQLVSEASNLIKTKTTSVGPVLQKGGVAGFRDVQNFPWGMLEPSSGQYEWGLLDQLVQSYQTYNLDYVAVAMPFASWDLASLGPAATICQHFFNEDYKYLAATGSMGRYVNLDAFINLVGKGAERYDGDGRDDMAGLTRPIRYWQIHNEPEGENCGSFRSDPQAFVELMRRSYTAIKAACPECQVLNGGAGLTDPTKNGGTFWQDFARLGGASYTDIIAVHFNEGKHDGEEDETVFETRLNQMKAALGSDKPIWMTEFGVAVGVPPGGFINMTEPQAAAWFTRFYTAGLAGGVRRFFSDAFAFEAENNRTIKLPYYTNRLLQAKLGGFTQATRLTTGQYRFQVQGQAVYVLWSGVPAELSGTVTAWDIYGNETVASASSLAPTAQQPLIVTQSTAASFTLQMSKIGNGTVTSSPSGLDCGATCSASYSNGTPVTLTAAAASGAVFTGWSGDCSGVSSTCALTMDAAKNVTAKFGGSALACSTGSQTLVQKAYIGYYNRCADQGGMAFWCTELDKASGNLGSIIAAFGTSAEYTQRFSGLTDSQLIEGLYTNMFNRSVESAGQNFYLGLLDQRRLEWKSSHGGSGSGATEYALSRIALDILNGSSGGDLATLNGKIPACPAF